MRRSFLSRMRFRRENSVLLLNGEEQIGRTGKLFTVEHFDLETNIPNAAIAYCLPSTITKEEIIEETSLSACINIQNEFPSRWMGGGETWQHWR